MIYLDNAATSFPKPESVTEAVAEALRCAAGNPGRGTTQAATAGTQALREVRAEVAAFFGVRSPERLVFAFNATDALNMAIKGILQPGAHVVTTALEHNSVLRPLVGLSERHGVELSRVKANAVGVIAVSDVEAVMRPDTRLVVMTHASNVLGTVQPVGDVARLCRSRRVPLLVDAAQSAGEIPIDVEELQIDMLAFSGHKALLGPPGTGGLYVHEDVELTPWREGGTGTQSEKERHPTDYPEHLEGGTCNLPGLLGLREGVRYLKQRGVATVHAQGMTLVDRLIQALRGDDRFSLYGPLDGDGRVPTLSLNIRGIEPSEVGLMLDQAFGIAVRTGLHCAAPTHRCIGTFPGGSVRISPGPFTTEDDIDETVKALNAIAASATD